MNRFCVNCGLETGMLVDSLCSGCYLKKHEVIPLPAELVLDLDTRSGRVRIGRDWIYLEDSVVERAIADKVMSLAKPKLLPVSGVEVGIEHKGNFTVARVKFVADMGGVPLEVKKEVNVRFRKTISDASMKIASYYHEAIIQLRFKEKPALSHGQAKLKELLGLIAEHKKKIELSHAIDTKNVPGGVDVLVGSAKAAKIVATKFARKYNVRVIYSNKMIGLDDNGAMKYRHTYCVKI